MMETQEGISNQEKEEIIFVSETLPNTRKKSLNLFDSTLLTMGSIIGTGIFLSVGDVVKHLDSIFYSLLMWVLCGLISLGAALCYAELGLLLPSSGGEYAFYVEAYHEILGFAFIECNIFLLRPIGFAILTSFTLETFINSIYSDVDMLTIRTYSVILVIVISFVQCLSDKVSIWIMNALTYLKFVGMAFIVGLALYMLCRGKTENIKDWNFKAKITPMKLACAFYPTMWTYDGFTQLIYFVKEIKNPTKNLVYASVIGIGLVTALYFLINFSYFVIIGVEGMKSFEGVAISIARPYIGKYSVIIAILVSFSSLGSAFGLAYASARIYSDAAKNNNFPLIFSAMHSSSKTLIPAIIIQAIFAIFYLAIPSNLEDFIWYFSGAAWIFYSLAIVAVVVLRFRKPGPRIFKVII
uniref:B(0,+)-type amino acid transporter 1 (Trinotate prediction) n=1 Tax=Myxobolus squamalis TaxID=59785 RepID=A0A6B2FX22_MYXSQ